MTEQSECTICLLDYNEETKTETECNHFFHQECLDKWLQTNYTCPLCRTELREQLQEPPIFYSRPMYGMGSSIPVTLQPSGSTGITRVGSPVELNVTYRNPEELDEVWALLDSISATTDSISATAAAAEDNSSDEEDEYTRIYGSHIRVNFD